MQPLVRLTYFSKALVDPSCNEVMRGIMMRAALRNSASGVTGVLAAGPDSFLQLIEGPRDAISETIGRIARDPRHTDLVAVEVAESGERLFPQWRLATAEHSNEQLDALSFEALSASSARQIYSLLASLRIDTRASAIVGLNLTAATVVL